MPACMRGTQLAVGQQRSRAYGAQVGTHATPTKRLFLAVAGTILAWSPFPPPAAHLFPPG